MPPALLTQCIAVPRLEGSSMGVKGGVVLHQAHPVIMHELVHAAGPQRGAHGVHDRHAGVDVADQLRLALAGVRALPQQDDLGLLQQARRGTGLSTASCTRSELTCMMCCRAAICQCNSAGTCDHRYSPRAQPMPSYFKARCDYSSMSPHHHAVRHVWRCSGGAPPFYSVFLFQLLHYFAICGDRSHALIYCCLLDVHY